MIRKPRIIVLDDDPTGSQTVHSCLLLTRWDVDTLRLGLRDDVPIFFILTNTRALTPTEADQVTRQVTHNLQQAIALENITDYLIVSRSDSTLRGHYPVETDAIAEELGPFDAHFLLPAFFEGGRFTKDSVHYLIVNGIPTPVHETEFAKDSVFAYSYSYLPDYVAEKTQGKITADQVTRFLLGDIRKGCLSQLMILENNQCCVVDGETQADFDQFAQDILQAASQGKKFLFRSAASILTSLANLGPQPIPAEAMAKYVRGGKPGVVIMGSHVKKSTAQLECLLQAPNIEGIEVDVSLLLEDQPTVREKLLNDILTKINSIHNVGKTPVVYTSRQELQFPDTQVRLAFGVRVSRLLMDIVRGLPSDIGFLISKGGITSNDTLSDGLNLPTARLLGQILAGVSLVITPPDHPLFPNLPVVLFPGNVGNNDGLATVYQRLSQA
jgi:uncharacterized protein YgbK (DUF1537 family)